MTHTQQERWAFQAEFISAAAEAGRKVGANMAAITAYYKLLAANGTVYFGQMAAAGREWAAKKAK